MRLSKWNPSTPIKKQFRHVEEYGPAKSARPFSVKIFFMNDASFIASYIDFPFCSHVYV